MISSLSALDFSRNDPTNVGRVWDQMQISGLSPRRVRAARAGYRLAGPSRSDNLPLSAKGAISQQIYHQKRRKNRVKVIIMSSQVILPPPKAPPRLNIVLWRADTRHERKGGGTVIGRERDTLTDRKWKRPTALK